MRATQKKKNKWPWILAVISIIVVIAIGLVAYWWSGVYNALDNFSKPDEDSRFKDYVEQAVPVPTWEGKERVNILLLGGDARGLDEGQLARSDSLLVASFDPVTKKVHLFSVLRDTYVPIEGHGRGRINSALTLGGPTLAMQTVGELLGLEIQYYVYTDFEGFKALIDTMGGIYFDVEKNMRYTDNADGNQYDINLKKGYQLLDGDKALQYVRFRHDALSDYSRTERQRNLLKAVAKEMMSTWNIVKMEKILNSIEPYVEMNISVSDMLKLGQLGVSGSIAGSSQVPPMEMLREETIGGASVIAVRDTDDLHSYIQEVLAVDENAPAATDMPKGMDEPVESGSPDNASGSSSGGSSTGAGNNSSGSSSGNGVR